MLVAVGCLLFALGSGLWAVGCGLWAVDSGQWTVGCELVAGDGLGLRGWELVVLVMCSDGC